MFTESFTIPTPYVGIEVYFTGLFNNKEAYSQYNNSFNYLKLIVSILLLISVHKRFCNDNSEEETTDN